MTYMRLLLLWALLAPLAGAKESWNSSFSASAAAAAAGGPQTRSLVFPLEYYNASTAPPRGLLRSGRLPIHGAVREGCVLAAVAAAAAPTLRALRAALRACCFLHAATQGALNLLNPPPPKQVLLRAPLARHAAARV